MKKILIAMVCLMVVGIQSVNAQNAKIILHHNGAATFFASNQTSEALDAAVDGDTIYMNIGTFTGDITITKKVTLIGAAGAGAVTRINGYINIALEDETLSADLLIGLYIENDITIEKPVKGLVIRHCTFPCIHFNAAIEDSFIDNCDCGGAFNLSENIKYLNINNTKIGTVGGNAASAESVVFNNCNIGILSVYWGLQCLATYRNSIINDLSEYNHWTVARTTTFINCLLKNESILRNSEYYNCYIDSNNLLDSWVNCNYSTEELTEKGYFGTDGKVVGIFGGESPFTMIPSSPKITDYSSSVDPTTRKITVNLKVTNQ